MTRRLEELERVEVLNAGALRAWLEAEHDRTTSCWLVTFKKSAGERYLPYNAIVEQLLCFGWVDSLPRALDAERTMLLISPRKPGSNWSKDNRERVAKLEREGLMADAGRAIVARAKADGSWDRLKQTENGEAPPDLAEALAEAGAMQAWEGYTLSVRRRALEFLLAAKRPETRARRIGTIVSASLEGADPTQWVPNST